jgi:ABC-type uncharacterized transport system auxiliary subunit
MSKAISRSHNSVSSRVAAPARMTSEPSPEEATLPHVPARPTPERSGQGAGTQGAPAAMERPRWLALLSLGAVLLAAFGCVSLGQKAPQPDYYMLTVQPPAEAGERPAAAGPAALHPILLVSGIESNPPFDRYELLYRNGETDWKRDYYNRFMASPGEMAAEATRRWLRGTGLFGTVVGPDAPVEPDYVLRGTLEAIYGDYRHGDRAAVMEIEFALIEPDGARGRLLLSSDYPARVPLRGLSSAALVEGLDTALTDILTALSVDLRSRLEAETGR